MTKLTGKLALDIDASEKNTPTNSSKPKKLKMDDFSEVTNFLNSNGRNGLFKKPEARKVKKSETGKLSAEQMKPVAVMFGCLKNL